MHSTILTFRQCSTKLHTTQLDILVDQHTCEIFHAGTDVQLRLLILIDDLLEMSEMSSITGNGSISITNSMVVVVVT